MVKAKPLKPTSIEDLAFHQRPGTSARSAAAAKPASGRAV
jgi:hypothetical protein